MIKGCSRRMIMVKDTGSRYFDSAYFIVKCDLPGSCGEVDMLSEAHRMIESYSSHGIGIMPPPKKRRRTLLALLCAAVCEAIIIGAVMLILLL